MYILIKCGLLVHLIFFKCCIEVQYTCRKVHSSYTSSSMNFHTYICIRNSVPFIEVENTCTQLEGGCNWIPGDFLGFWTMFYFLIRGQGTWVHPIYGNSLSCMQIKRETGSRHQVLCSFVISKVLHLQPGQFPKGRSWAPRPLYRSDPLQGTAVTPLSLFFFGCTVGLVGS